MRVAVAAAVLLAAVTFAGAAQSPVVNARVERRQTTQPVQREVQTIADRGTASWVGYRVPIARTGNATLRSSELRSSDTCCGRCRLEPPTELVVLARVEGKTLVELRPISVDCDVDAAGMPLVWLDGVNPDDSVTWLASLAGSTSTSSHITNSALVALSQHASASVAPVLVRFAREGTTSRMRSQALFWLAQRAAAEALPAINAALDQDPDTELKKQAVYALSRLPADEGIPRLMELVRTHRNTEVRRQAIFWLGQSKDPRVADFFEGILSK